MWKSNKNIRSVQFFRGRNELCFTPFYNRHGAKRANALFVFAELEVTD
jgi:hypothetical protein